MLSTHYERLFSMLFAPVKHSYTGFVIDESQKIQIGSVSTASLKRTPVIKA